MSHTNASFFFFFNDTATTEIYTLSLHDALPIFIEHQRGRNNNGPKEILLVKTHKWGDRYSIVGGKISFGPRSEEHTSELQSHSDLVCRLLLEKKKTHPVTHIAPKAVD